MTYWLLDVLFVVVAGAVVAWAVRAAGLGRRWWRTTAVVAAVLLVATAVFDNVMIAADLFRFDDAALLGLRVGRMPVEDFAWPLAAAFGLPALWELLGARRGSGVRDER